MEQLIITLGHDIIKLTNKATKIYNISAAWAFKAYSFRVTEINALKEYRSNLLVDSGIDTRTI